MIDRLPDWAYTAEELLTVDIDEAMKRVDGTLVEYKLYGPRGDTGKVMVVLVDDMIATMNLLNEEWREVGIRLMLGRYRPCGVYEYAALKMVWYRDRYVPKYKCTGWDKVYNKEITWIGKID